MGKAGRPAGEHPKTNKVTIRISADDYAKLIDYNKKHNQTITDTMSEAFHYFMESKEQA